jgi:MscS family membrane protein
VRPESFSVHFVNFGPSALEIRLDVAFLVQDYASELIEREALLLDIKTLAEELGVEFAYPTLTIHLRRDFAAEETTAGE